MVEKEIKETSGEGAMGGGENKLPDKQGAYKVGNKHPPKESQWKPGESGNSAGRPPKDVSITSHIKRLLELEGDQGKTNAELIAQALINIAKDNLNTKGKASIVKEVLDRVEGKVKDTLTIEGGSVSINFIPARPAIEGETIERSTEAED